MRISATEFIGFSEEERDEYFIWVDHREFEDSIVSYVAEKIQEPLQPILKEERLWVNLEGVEYEIPLTHTPHDRYVAISSIAELLSNKYDFWLHKPRIQDDTHGLLITTKSFSEELQSHPQWLEENLLPLELGYDYFSDIKVPYLGHLNNNSNFESEAMFRKEAVDAFKAELTKAFNSPEMQNTWAEFRKEIAALSQPWWKRHFKSIIACVLLLYLLVRSWNPSS